MRPTYIPSFSKTYILDDIEILDFSENRAATLKNIRITFVETLAINRHPPYRYKNRLYITFFCTSTNYKNIMPNEEPIPNNIIRLKFRKNADNSIIDAYSYDLRLPSYFTISRYEERPISALIPIGFYEESTPEISVLQVSTEDFSSMIIRNLLKESYQDTTSQGGPALRPGWSWNPFDFNMGDRFSTRIEKLHIDKYEYKSSEPYTARIFLEINHSTTVNKLSESNYPFFDFFLCNHEGGLVHRIQVPIDFRIGQNVNYTSTTALDTNMPAVTCHSNHFLFVRNTNT